MLNKDVSRWLTIRSHQIRDEWILNKCALSKKEKCTEQSFNAAFLFFSISFSLSLSSSLYLHLSFSWLWPMALKRRFKKWETLFLSVEFQKCAVSSEYMTLIDMFQCSSFKWWQNFTLPSRWNVQTLTKQCIWLKWFWHNHQSSIYLMLLASFECEIVFRHQIL